MTVGEFCNRDVVIIRGNESLHTAAGLMRDHRVGSVVVVEDRGTKCYPVATLTDRDLVVRVLGGALQGIVSFDDLVEHLAEVLEALTTLLKRGRAHEAAHPT